MRDLDASRQRAEESQSSIANGWTMRAASFELLMAPSDGEATAVSRALEAEQRSPSPV